MQTVYVQNTSFHTQIQMTDINQKVASIGNLPLNLLQPVIHFLDQGARNLVEYYFQIAHHLFNLLAEEKAIPCITSTEQEGRG